MPGQQLTQRKQGNRWVWEGFGVAADSCYDTKNPSRTHKEEKNQHPIDVQGKEHAVDPLGAARPSHPSIIFSCWEKG